MAITIGNSTGRSIYDIAGPTQRAYERQGDAFQGLMEGIGQNVKELGGEYVGRQRQALARQQHLQDVGQQQQFAREQDAQQQQFAREQGAQQEQYRIAGQERQNLSMAEQNLSKDLGAYYDQKRKFKENNWQFSPEQNADEEKGFKLMEENLSNPRMSRSLAFKANTAILQKLAGMGARTPIQTPDQLLDQEYVDKPGFGLVNPSTGKQLLPAAKSATLTEQLQQATIRKNGTDAAHKAYEVTGDIDYANTVGRNNDPNFIPLPEIDEDLSTGRGRGSGSRGRGAQSDLTSHEREQAIISIMGVKRLDSKGNPTTNYTHKEAAAMVDEERSTFKAAYEEERAIKRAQRQEGVLSGGAQPAAPPPNFVDAALQRYNADPANGAVPTTQLPEMPGQAPAGLPPEAATAQPIPPVTQPKDQAKLGVLTGQAAAMKAADPKLAKTIENTISNLPEIVRKPYRELMTRHDAIENLSPVKRAMEKNPAVTRILVDKLTKTYQDEMAGMAQRKNLGNEDQRQKIREFRTSLMHQIETVQPPRPDRYTGGWIK